MMRWNLKSGRAVVAELEKAAEREPEDKGIRINLAAARKLLKRLEAEAEAPTPEHPR